MITGKVGDTIYGVSNGGGEQKNINLNYDPKWDDEQYVRYEKQYTWIIYKMMNHIFLQQHQLIRIRTLNNLYLFESGLLLSGVCWREQY